MCGVSGVCVLLHKGVHACMIGTSLTFYASPQIEAYKKEALARYEQQLKENEQVRRQLDERKKRLDDDQTRKVGAASAL